ncbi:MAG TPA: hypothetical protein DCP92_05065 [Nitrospiraceae bacterium]|nr:hypothetical protein [Nitrospiraceae bacterium]
MFFFAFFPAEGSIVYSGPTILVYGGRCDGPCQYSKKTLPDNDVPVRAAFKEIDIFAEANKIIGGYALHSYNSPYASNSW